MTGARGYIPLFGHAPAARQTGRLNQPPKATWDINERVSDPNNIIDPVCPRRFSGIACPAAPSTAMDIPFKLREIDCEPFLHGDSKSYIDAGVTLAFCTFQ